jgi:hypothetical protein
LVDQKEPKLNLEDAGAFNFKLKSNYEKEIKKKEK